MTFVTFNKVELTMEKGKSFTFKDKRINDTNI